MATTIKLKNSVTTTNAPSSLVQGEVAINITDKKVWVGNAATTPIQLLGDGGSASFTSIAFGAGTVSLPSITFTGDTNTGIYSPAADTIAFTEGGVEAMRIDSSGRVGIGTSSPNQQLEISNATEANISLLATGTNGKQYNLISTAGASGLGQGSFSIFDRTAALSRIIITSTGNVGIGIETPSARLQVTGNSGNAIAVFDKGGANQAFTQLKNSSISYNTYVDINNNGTNIWALYDATNNHSMAFYTPGASGLWQFFTANTERMRIDSSGNVGIGTSSPAYKVNAVVTSGADAFFADGNAQSFSGYRIRAGASGQQWAFRGGNTTMALTDVTAGADRLVIDSSGNVGIGTSSPSTFAGYIGVTVSSTSGGFIDVKSTTGSITGFFDADNGTTAVSIGSRTNHPLKFITNNTERMRITSGGDLLVGTTTTAGPGGAAVVSGKFYNQAQTLVIANNGATNVVALSEGSGLMVFAYVDTNMYASAAVTCRNGDLAINYLNRDASNFCGFDASGQTLRVTNTGTGGNRTANVNYMRIL